MKPFRTTIQAEASVSKITYHTPLLFLGSCFTENIGNKMMDLKFPALINPFGVLYNPVSVRNSLEILLDKKTFKEKDLDYFNKQWFSFYHDTEFSNIDKQFCLDNINNSVCKATDQLKNAKFLVITFGTAWVYRYTKTGNIVSNCHKIPAREFERFKLGVEDIYVEWAKLINRITELNPDIKIIFTVSPVRHWKDGAVQNQLSKSTLILAVHQLLKIFENVEYFPAYEIMMDDLRDYRFYNDDMIHPSPTAIQYIWEKFTNSSITDKAQKLMKQIEKINQAIGHKPFQVTSESHQKFIKSTLKKIEEIEQNSNIKFVCEKEALLKQVI